MFLNLAPIVVDWLINTYHNKMYSSYYYYWCNYIHFYDLELVKLEFLDISNEINLELNLNYDWQLNLLEKSVWNIPIFKRKKMKVMLCIEHVKLSGLIAYLFLSLEIIKNVLYYWDNVIVFPDGFSYPAESSQIGCIPLHWVRGLVNWDLGKRFIFITKCCGNYGHSRMWVKNFTLNILVVLLIVCWLLNTACGLGCWLGGLAAILAASVGWTVDWRLGGLAAIMSKSVVIAGIFSGLGVTYWYAGALVMTFGMAASFMCIHFSLQEHLVFSPNMNVDSQFWIGPLQERSIFWSVDLYLLLTVCIGAGVTSWNAHHITCCLTWTGIRVWWLHCQGRCIYCNCLQLTDCPWSEW